MHDDTPDYSAYSLPQLYDVRQHINREKFPDRYQKVLAEIERKEQSGETEVVDKEESRAKHINKARNFGAVFFALGVLEFFYLVAEPAAFTFRSRNWPSISCVTLHEKKEYSSQTDLIYSYHIKGTEYIGRRLSSTESPRKTRSWLKQYKDGKRAFCFVNPNDAQESVLTWGWSGTLLFFLVHSSGMIGGGLHAMRHPEEVRFKGDKKEAD